MCMVGRRTLTQLYQGTTVPDVSFAMSRRYKGRSRWAHQSSLPFVF